MLNKCAALLLLLPLLGSCSIDLLGIKAHAGYMNLTPRGDLGLNDSGNGQSLGDIKIDVEDDFNIDDAGTPYLRAEMPMGADWHVTVSGFYYDESGSSLLTSSFGDLPLGSTVISDLSILNVKTAFTYDIPLTGLAGLDLGIGICIDYFKVDLDVNASSPVVGFESIDFNAPVPMLYGKARFDLPMIPLAVAADIGWLNVDLSDAKGSFFDAELMAIYTVLPGVEIFAGYRYTVIDAIGDVDGQDFDTDLRLDGWYFGGGMKF